jgi:hypothetical protein
MIIHHRIFACGPYSGNTSMSSRTQVLRFLLPVIAMGGAALAPSHVGAQTAGEVRLRLFFGALDTRGDLTNAPILAAPTNVVSYDDFGAAPAMGLGLQLRPFALPVSFRISASRSLGSEETGRWGCAPDPSGEPTPCPSILILVETDMTTTASTADLVGDVAVGRLTLHPIAGLGWVRSSYRWNPEDVGSFSLQPGRASDDAMALHLALGMSVPVGAFDVQAEYSWLYAKAGPRRPGATGTATMGVSVPLR